MWQGGDGATAAGNPRHANMLPLNGVAALAARRQGGKAARCQVGKSGVAPHHANKLRLNNTAGAAGIVWERWEHWDLYCVSPINMRFCEVAEHALQPRRCVAVGCEKKVECLCFTPKFHHLFFTATQRRGYNLCEMKRMFIGGTQYTWSDWGARLQRCRETWRSQRCQHIPALPVALQAHCLRRRQMAVYRRGWAWRFASVAFMRRRWRARCLSGLRARLRS